MPHPRDIVIIGNGPGGNAAAWAIRQHDSQAKVSIFSEEEDPLYSACFLHDYLAGELDHGSLFLKKKDDYAKAGVQVFWGKAVREIDPGRKLLYYEGGEKEYSHLILATGSRAILPMVEGRNLPGVFLVKTLQDAQGIGRYIEAYQAKRVGVVGAGPIGIEVAVSLKKKGLEVFLVEKEKSISARIFHPKLARKLEEKIESGGIRVFTGLEMVKILGQTRVRAARLSDQSELNCDLVIFAVGMKPRSDLARQAQIQTGPAGGILVNERALTQAPDVYACGDCAEVRDALLNDYRIVALWPNAVTGGKTAGLNALGIAQDLPAPIDLNRMNVFGWDAIALGYSDELVRSMGKADSIEGSVAGHEYRLILLEGNLLGIQIIGMNFRPPLFTFIYKKEKLFRLKNAFPGRELVGRNPLYHALRWRWPQLPGPYQKRNPSPA